MKISIFPIIDAYRGNGNFTAMCCFDSDGALCAYQDYGEYGVVILLMLILMVNLLHTLSLVFVLALEMLEKII